MAATATVPSDWVSIGHACRLLGVNAATLRQWTAAGKLQAYRTPGGHRRFSASELTALSEQHAASLTSVAEDMVAQLRGRYRTLAESEAAHEGWLGELGPAARGRYHALGDELLGLLGEYLRGGSGRRNRALERARTIGEEYGVLASQAGIATSQAVETYLLFRRPLLDVLSRALAAQPGAAAHLSRIMRDAERFMDEVLVGMASVEKVAR